MPPARGSPLTPTMRVINGIHHNTTDRRTNPLVPIAPRLTHILVAMVGVGNRANRGTTFLANNPQLARRQADLCVSTIAPDELSISASRPRDLPTLTRF